MGKETQKTKIERLENELWEQKALVGKLQKEIYDMQDKSEETFENSPTYIQQEKLIKQQGAEIKALKGQLEHEKKVREFTSNNKPQNERGAGRKEKFSDQDKELIRMYRIQGKTIKELAEIYECSVGLIHKLISE